MDGNSLQHRLTNQVVGRDEITGTNRSGAKMRGEKTTVTVG